MERPSTFINEYAVEHMRDMFWDSMGAQLDGAGTARTVDDIIQVFRDPLIHGKDYGFFGGSGGDRQLLYELDREHWSVVWCEAEYWFVAQDCNGDTFTYTEGDIERGDHRRSDGGR